jgi:hypothetical protein
VIRVASSQPAGPTDESRKLAELSRDLIRSTTGLASKCQTALDNARSSLLNTGDSLVESLNPTPRRYSPERPQPTTVVVTQPSPDRAASDDLARASEAMPWYQIVWLQIAIGGGAIVVTPLMLALVLGIMLRRSGLQFRVEVVNSVPGTGIAFGVTRLDDATARPVGHLDATDPNRPGHLAAPPDDTPDELPSTAQPFDLGPTYEEERAAREDAVQLQEQALLQEVFEQNLRLRDELAQLDGPPAAAAAPVDLMALAAAESAEEDIVVEPIGYVTEVHEQGI